MQDPNQDTEWNDVLRAKGILPPKEIEVTENQLLDMVDDVIAQKSGHKDMGDMSLEELDELEDEMLNDERVLMEYRMKRMAEMKQQLSREQFGEIREISQTEFVGEVSEASKNVWVVAFLYKEGYDCCLVADCRIPACKLMRIHLEMLAGRYRATKFVSIIGDKCIPNYPDKNLPTLLIYGRGDIVRQQIGLVGLGGMTMTVKDLEIFLGFCGAIEISNDESLDDEEYEEKIIRGRSAQYAARASDSEED